MNIRRAQPAETGELKEWIKANHYLKSTPPGFVCLLEFREGTERIGAMLIGRPASRALDADRVLELSRMYFVDSAGPNTESRALAMMRRFIRVWYPCVKLLISYSDPAAGHRGTIYEADNWAPFGMTKRDHWYGWKRHGENRSSQQVVSQKQRWVRTP